LSSNTEDLLKKIAEASPAGPTGHSEKAANYIDAHISRLVSLEPIYGTVFLYLNKRQSRDLDTLGITTINRIDLGLLYNPEFVLSLTPTELAAVLRHESLHVLLHHIDRSSHYMMKMKDYNIAADMAINCHIAGLPEGGLYPSTFNLPDFQASEWYFSQMKKKAGEGGYDDASAMAEGLGGLVDSHDGWDEFEDDIIKEKIKGIADKAISAQESKGWSALGAELAKQILEANKPVVNWKREVRWFINQVIESGRRSTRSRINRREQALRSTRQGDLKNVYMQPGTRRDYTSKILIGIDTSGSVSDKEVKAFLGEINGMVGLVQCHVILFDTKIIGEPVEIKKKIRGLEIKGRGGTDFGPIIRYVDEHKYDGLIIMTDGFAPFPAKPKSRVLWAISPQGDSVKPPYGKRVRVEIKD